MKGEKKKAVENFLCHVLVSFVATLQPKPSAFSVFSSFFFFTDFVFPDMYYSDYIVALLQTHSAECVSYGQKCAVGVDGVC